ncbi:MAG: adenylosuccinate lyase [bacterium]
MIPRYTRREMGRIWEQETRLKTWLEIEIAICEAWASLGEIPMEALEKIRSKASFSVQRVEEIEKVTKHDVIAFVTCVAESIGPEGRYLHLGVTSSDILDTSMALSLRDAADLIIQGMGQLLGVLKRMALEHKHTIMVGRTHGVHAEPITFGLKLLIWYEETRRNLERLKRAREIISYGKISGAVGTYAHVDPRVEQYVCQKLGLKPATVSSQIIQRDRYAEYFTTLAVIASSLEKFALEIRHLQRTEVQEAQEGFSTGQKGSSAMPHKINPITAENLCGLARLVRANAQAALENVALWHERDISHSSVERVIGPDSTILVDTMVYRMTRMLEGLRVNSQIMMENLERTRGLVYSEGVLLLLVRKGLSREKAYELVQRNAMRVWNQGIAFLDALEQDQELMAHVDKEELRACFDLHKALKHVDLIFHRVLSQAE